MKKTNVIALILFSLFVLSCEKTQPNVVAPEAETVTETAPDKKAVAKKGDNSGHAPHGAVAGSHEDWCGGHQVPESLCSRCNPSLIAGFKATGDWCEKHNLPESQCLACNPDLKIERPAKASK